MQRVFHSVRLRLSWVVIFFVCSQPMPAQQDSISFANSITSWLKNNPKEKVFLHISKPHFLTGETIWFRIYHYAERDHLPFSMSKVVYVDLINSNNESVLQHKIKINRSGGTGWMYLPTNLNSGRYRIRAFTNWMRNFDDNGFYSSEILIVNPFKRLNLQANDSVKPDLQFFPEGGYLVSDIESRVGFKATGLNGKGQHFAGLVISEQQDTVIRFTSNQFGIGSFWFTPAKDKQYHALLVDSAGHMERFPFAEIRESGYVMHAEAENDKYRIYVSYKGLLKAPDRRIYLAGISRDKFLFIRKMNGFEKSTFFEIPTTSLNEGINQFTLFDENGFPVCERLVFKYPENNLNINGELSDAHPGQRSAMEIKLKTTDHLNSPIPADLSVSVYRSDANLIIKNPDIVSYMWLSDIKGIVEEPGYYFANRSPKVDKDMDDLMLTQGWRIYDVSAMRGNVNESLSFEYIPEFINQTISGKITLKGTGEPVPNTLVYLSFPNSYAQLFAAKSNNAGRIVFETKDIYGERVMVIRPEKMKENVVITLEDPFGNPAPSYLWGQFELSSTVEPFLVDQNTNMQIENIFAAPDPHKLVFDSLSFYNIPDASYLLDDYTRFPVMEEVMREYVYSVFVRRNKGKFLFKVVDEARNKTMEEEPLILLDGVPVFDVDEIMAVDPLKIRKIDVIHSKYFYGYLSSGGIVAYYSYHSDLPDIELDENTLKANYKGLQDHKVFFEPTYDSEAMRENRTPDFRNHLHWEPEISTDKNGECVVRFYTSDAQGTYTIQVNGLSASGLPGSYSSTFEVVAEKVR